MLLETTTFDDLLKNLIELSKDPSGSRLIQKKFEECSAPEKEQLINKILPEISTLSKDIFGNRKTYKDFCLKNGYMTKHKKPQCRFTAEILYRYLTLDTQFAESHTGLEDVLIETEILRNCFKAHKKMTKTLY